MTRLLEFLSGLAGLAAGVAAVALGLAGGFFLDQAGGLVGFGLNAGGLGSFSIGGSGFKPQCLFLLAAGLFGALCFRLGGAACLAGFGHRQTLGLANRLAGFGSLLGGPEIFKLGFFGFYRCLAAV